MISLFKGDPISNAYSFNVAGKPIHVDTGIGLFENPTEAINTIMKVADKAFSDSPVVRSKY